LGNNKIQSIKTLRETSRNTKEFVNTLDFNEWEIIEKAKEDIRKFNEKSRQEALWLHLFQQSISGKRHTLRF
jgi:histidinol dehydrogenase